MEPEIKKIDKFEIPSMTDFLKSPIKFVTVPYDKINNERLEEAKALFSEQGELLETWRTDYLEDINWGRTRGVQFSNRIIESLKKLIDLQIRMVEHSDETVKKIK